MRRLIGSIYYFVALHYSRVSRLVTVRLGAGIILLWLSFMPGMPAAREVFAVTSGTVTATVAITVCGNGAVETGEQCDGSNLNSQTCASQGYASGNLSCTAACDFNTNSCAAAAPPSGGGGGGGGGGVSVAAPAATEVTFSGSAYPLSTVMLLKDGQAAGSVTAGSDARFNVSLSALAGGNYTFSVIAKDNRGNRSTLFTFPAHITQGATTNITGIFLAPTISIDKQQVKQGNGLAIFGQSVPFGDVAIYINSNREQIFNVSADKNGSYLYNLNTGPLDLGQYSAKAKTTDNGVVSPFSEVVNFAVGDTTIAKPSSQISEGDSNGDGKVNLVDFSILAYWYKRPEPPEAIDLNGDKKVDLVDFSIMAFNWTG